MSQGDDLFAPREGSTPPPAFEITLRGYDKRQVDDFVSRVDHERRALMTERNRAHRQAQDLTTRLDELQMALNDARQQPPQVDRASFSDLGPTVNQIVTLAEQQAKTITDNAAQQAADRQAEAERALTDARERASRLRSDGEAAYERAQQEAQRLSEQGAQELQDARSEAEALVDAARTQTQQEVQTRQQALTELQVEVDSAEQQLGRSRQQAETAEQEVTRLQQRLEEVNEELAAETRRLEEAREAADSAERDAQAVRARVHREAERVAQLAASAVMAAAERGAEPTGEYPLVVPVTSGSGAAAEAAQLSGEVSEPRAGEIAEPRAEEVPEPRVGEVPEPRAGEATDGMPAPGAVTANDRGHPAYAPRGAIFTPPEPETGEYPVFAPRRPGESLSVEMATEPGPDGPLERETISGDDHTWRTTDRAVPAQRYSWHRTLENE